MSGQIVVAIPPDLSLDTDDDELALAGLIIDRRDGWLRRLCDRALVGKVAAEADITSRHQALGRIVLR